MNRQRVMAIASKEWREIVRDRIYFLLAFLLPPMLMLVFCYGIAQDVENLPFAIVDYDRSEMSRDYANRYIVSRYFAFKGYLDSTRAAEKLMADGSIVLVLVIPERFQERLLAGRSIALQSLLDGTFTLRARTAQGYIEAINSAESFELQAGYIARRLGVTPERAAVLLQPMRMEVRYLYNQELRSVWGVAASMMMFILLLSAPLLSALSVVREKETGTIYNVYASTITRAEFLAGKLIPNVLISFINAVILWLIAIYYFGAPFKGGIVFFLAATLIYVLCVSALGLLVSLLVRTQQAALMVTVVVSVVVATQFSGMQTPVSLLTGPNYAIAHLLPAMYYHNIALDTFLKGAGLRDLWPDVLILSLYSAGLLGVVYLLFHKRRRA